MIQKNYSELFEFTATQMAALKKAYMPLKGKTLSMDQINKLNNMLSKLSKDQLVKLANTDIPFVSTGAKSVAVMKKGMKWSDFKRPLDMSEADELQCEACWTGYKQVGFKTSSRTGRRVPNCVPEENNIDEADNKLLDVLKKKLSDEGGAAGFKDLEDAADKVGVDLTQDMLKKMSGIKQHRDGDYILENTKLAKFNQFEELNAWGELPEEDKSGKKLNNPTRGDVKKYKVYVKNDKGNVVKVEFGDPNMSIKRDDPERRKNFRARHNCDNPGPKYKARYWSCKFWSTKSVTDLMKG